MLSGVPRVVVVVLLSPMEVPGIGRPRGLC